MISKEISFPTEQAHCVEKEISQSLLVTCENDISYNGLLFPGAREGIAKGHDVMTYNMVAFCCHWRGFRELLYCHLSISNGLFVSLVGWLV